MAGGENYSEAGILIISSGGGKGGKGGYGGGSIGKSGKGGHGGGHGNKPSVKLVKVFAGGSSRAYGK